MHNATTNILRGPLLVHDARRCSSTRLLAHRRGDQETDHGANGRARGADGERDTSVHAQNCAKFYVRCQARRRRPGRRLLVAMIVISYFRDSPAAAMVHDSLQARRMSKAKGTETSIAGFFSEPGYVTLGDPYKSPGIQGPLSRACRTLRMSLRQLRAIPWLTAR